MLSTERLEALLRALHAGHLQFPVRKAELMAGGLGDVADRAEILVGLDERGLRAVLVAVLAERRRER